MINIYEYETYQEFLKDLTKSAAKAKDESFTSTGLTSCLGVTGPTFSKIMNGSLVLQEDHVYLLAEHLKLNPDETRYLGLLGEHQRSGLESRRKILETKRIELQRQNHNTPSHLKTDQVDFTDIQAESEYYTNPWAPIIHIYLTIPRFQKNTDDIASELGLSKDFLLETLKLLERIKLIKKLPTDVWVPQTRTLHSANLSYLPSAQQLLTRAISLQQLSSQGLNERYGLSVSFSTDPNTHEKARQLLIECIDQIHKLVTNTKPEQVYHLTIDLFNWKKNR